MSTSRKFLQVCLPLAIYALFAFIFGCGGAGGGGSASGQTGGVTGGDNNSGSNTGTNGNSGTSGSTTGETGGTTGETGGTTGETGGTTGETGGTTGDTGGTTGTSGGDAGAFIFLSDKDGALAVYSANADGTGLTTVSSLPDVGAPCLSWDGTQIAFEQWSLYGSVFKMSANGSGSTAVYTPDLDCLNPSLSPDNAFVIFSMNETSLPQIFRTTNAGSGLTQLTNDPNGAVWARYSPDGSKIVFVSAGGSVDIKVMNADGSGVQTLASGWALQDMPMWSPDGSTIVFMENYGTDFSPNYQIMKVGASGGTPIRMTTSMQDDRSPCFTEDGAFILFTRRFGDATEVCRMPASGGTSAQVTTFGQWTGWLSAKKR